ncbi:MAG: L,D-transpeptidase [Kaiparowitsia implicata GSE-PSE-MK54-09C]|nr:L,D-transpeptidase [Kaiparowitsia implicata GSE-PSE-MK54-09C]
MLADIAPAQDAIRRLNLSSTPAFIDTPIGAEDGSQMALSPAYEPYLEPVVYEAEADVPLLHEAAVGEPLLIEIHLGDRRLTLYQGDTAIKQYPVAVGREGWQTPTGEFEVTQMIPDPAWQHPFTGDVILGGTPENPLGRYWIGFWTDGTNWVGMHGTPNPETVGTAASHGCIRLYNQDIEELFALVQPGTPVVVVP